MLVTRGGSRPRSSGGLLVFLGSFTRSFTLTLGCRIPVGLLESALCCGFHVPIVPKAATGKRAQVLDLPLQLCHLAQHQPGRLG